MNRFFSALLDLFFPPHCIYCDRILESARQTICQTCENNPLWVPDDTAPVKGKYYTACSFSAWYQGEIRQALLAFKFQGRSEYARSFSTALARTISLHFSEQYELLTWLPVSAERRAERGYDQSFLLAEATAALLEQPLISTLSKAHTVAQSSLKRSSARRANVQGAFSVPKPSLVQGKTVLLIDDIITTGNTLDAAAKALLDAGAARVFAACFAGGKLSQTEETHQ